MSEPSTQDRLFSKIKTRYVILWLWLFYLGFAGLYGTIASLTTFIPQLEDPVANNLLYTCSFVSLAYLLLDRLRNAQIVPQYIRGAAFPQYRWWYLLRLTAIFLVFSIGTGLLSFYLLFMIAPEYTQSLMKSLSESNQSSAMPIINQFLGTVNLVIIAPITEEFIFRGVILHRLAEKWNIPIAIWVSSIIFGLLHPNPIGISALGIAWALIYLKTKNLIVPIVAHAMNNGIVAIGQFLSPLVTTDGAAESITEIKTSDWLGCLLFIAISAPFVFQFIYQKFPSKSQILPYYANQNKAIAN